MDDEKVDLDRFGMSVILWHMQLKQKPWGTKTQRDYDGQPLCQPSATNFPRRAKAKWQAVFWDWGGFALTLWCCLSESISISWNEFLLIWPKLHWRSLFWSWFSPSKVKRCRHQARDDSQCSVEVGEFCLVWVSSLTKEGHWDWRIHEFRPFVRYFMR